MADPVTTRRHIYQGLYLLLSGAILIALLLPLTPGPVRFPAPDILLLTTMAWVLRRPDYVPVMFVAVVFLLADFLFLRPPGLWTAGVVLVSEFLRARESGWRDLPFLVEWGIVAALITGLMLGYLLVLAILFVDLPSLSTSLLHLLVTIAAYPLVVILTATLFGLRRVAPGEVDQLGRKQ